MKGTEWNSFRHPLQIRKGELDRDLQPTSCRMACMLTFETDECYVQYSTVDLLLIISVRYTNHINRLGA